MSTDADFWDGFYAESDRIWSGNPNVILVREVADLAPGTALDLGSGEGADAIWLAQRGWAVTAVDISQVALDRAARAATQAGVADRVDWQRHDLYASFPAGSFDLVTASFLHSYDAPPREAILRSAAAAVAAGGVLLIIGHSDHGPFHHDHGDLHLPKPAEVLAGLELADGEWEVLLCQEHERHQIGPDGLPATRTDNAVKLRRL